MNKAPPQLYKSARKRLGKGASEPISAFCCHLWRCSSTSYRRRRRGRRSKTRKSGEVLPRTPTPFPKRPPWVSEFEENGFGSRTFPAGSSGSSRTARGGPGTASSGAEGRRLLQIPVAGSNPKSFGNLRARPPGSFTRAAGASLPVLPCRGDADGETAGGEQSPGSV